LIPVTLTARAGARIGAAAISGSSGRPISGVHDIGRAADAEGMGLRYVRRVSRRLAVLRLSPFDAVLGAALVIASQIDVWLGGTSASPAAVAALGALATVPVAWRRRWPLVVLVISTLALGAIGSFENEGGVTAAFAVLVGCFTVGRELDPPATWAAPALAVALFGTGALIGAGGLNDLVFGGLLYVGVWGIGRVLRVRSRDVRELSDRAEQLEHDLEERAREAVADERARIARELHDVVSHSISVVTIQAQAVRRRLRPDQEREIEDLRGVETTARQAMAELRRLFGVLRAAGDRPSLAPAPGLGELERLVDRTRAAGLEVDLAVEGERRTLAPGIDLAAYRILQEALTNVLKHAGATRAAVTIRYGHNALALCVEDDGSGISPGRNGEGHGLIGMHERVSVYSGTLETGNRPDGGFRILARLPLDAAEGT
jgi:signal transduction histidine kinase